MLPLETQKLWDFVCDTPSLGGFILVGGTALTMHLNHRLSEDLDFMYPDVRLPVHKIGAFKRVCANAGFDFVENDNPSALAEFEDTGMDYRDYQQDYIVNGLVKVTFVAPEAEVRAQLNAANPHHPRVASVEEVFRLKCIACANRRKTRDWLDMYIMLKQGLFQPTDIYSTFERAGVSQKCDIALSHMCSGKVDLLDEGYNALMPFPPAVADMAAYFAEVRDQIQIARAKTAMAQRRP